MGSLQQGTRFKRLIKDQTLVGGERGHGEREEGIRRALLCSGKVGGEGEFWGVKLLRKEEDLKD